MICSNCKQNIDDDSKFCTNCGNKIQSSNFSKHRTKIIIGVLSVLVIVMGVLLIVKNTGKDSKQVQNTSLSSNNSGSNSSAESPASGANSNNSDYSSAGDSSSAGTSMDSSSSGRTDINGSSSTSGQSGTTQANSGSKASTTEKKTAEDLGYLKIEVNGEQRTYAQKYEAEKSVSWSVSFNSDKYSSEDSFMMTISETLSAGDKIKIDSGLEMDDLFALPIFFSYNNKEGELYSFGYPLGSSGEGQHYSSWATITIDSWGGMGGYVTGTINGEMKLTDSDTVTFKNGVFKFKLKSTGF